MPFVFNPVTGKLDFVNPPTTDASLLTTGTLADARLSSNVSLDNINNNFTAGQSITAAANTSALTASYSVTGANTTPLLDLSGTWNTTGVARGILLNVTDTASAVNSTLLSIVVGGTPRFSVRKDGAISFTSDLFSTTGPAFSTGGYGNAVVTKINGTDRFLVANNVINMTSGVNFGWASGATLQNNLDVALARDAANTLAQRNGGTAASPVPQTFRLYNYTDAGLTNFERAFMRWNANVFEIGTEAGGTGTVNREVSFMAGGNTFLKISPPANRIISSYPISPASDNSVTLGLATLRWQNIHTKGIVQNGTIGTTLTPATNGDLVIEQTANTTLTFKMRGTDGTVRSATLTLA
jgi:hypothetical protein